MRALHAAIAAALLLPAGAARADGAAFLRFGSVWIVDRGYDLFSTVDATPQVLVGGGWGVDERVDLELAWAFAGSSAQSFGTIDARFFLHQIQGAANVRLAGSELLGLGARGGAALAIARADVDGAGAAGTIEDTAFGLGLEGTLVAELRVPMGFDGSPDAAALGLSVEAGYGWHPFGYAFDDARLELDEDRRPRPTAPGPIALGTLDPSGPILRFGVALHF